MISVVLSSYGNVAGVDIGGTNTRTASGQLSTSTALREPRLGALTTRAGDTSGSLTLSSQHGVEEGDFFDIYWSGGRRFGVEAGIINSGTPNVVPFSGGEGDDLPDQGTVIVAMKPQVIDFDFDGDKLVVLAMKMGARGRVSFRAGGSELFGVDLLRDEPYIWFSGVAGFTNPLEGAFCDSIEVTHDANLIGADVAQFRIGLLYDNVGE